MNTICQNWCEYENGSQADIPGRQITCHPFSSCSTTCGANAESLFVDVVGLTMNRVSYDYQDVTLVHALLGSMKLKVRASSPYPKRNGTNARQVRQSDL
jgi:hypothetical protein